MKLSGKAVIMAILVAVGYGEWAHSQPMLSSYGIELDDRFTLIHSTGDAFSVWGGSGEVLMIDPVWDNMKLDAYCRLPKALLIRACNTNEGKRPLDASASYFIIDTPDTDAADRCTGPLSEGEFREKLISMSVSSGDVVWVIPANSHPIRRTIMMVFFLGMLIVMILGFVLPIPFALVLAHYVVLKKRLHRLTGAA